MTVVRLWTPALGKGSIVKRLSDYLSFLVGATVALVRLPRQDVVISLTTPPFLVLSAVAHKVVRRRCRVVLWSMDCYPDVIERLGSRTSGGPVVHVGRRSPRVWALETVRGALRPVASLRRGGPVSTVLRAVNRWAFRRVDHVVALDEAMRDLLLEGYGSADGTRPPATVIPNWEALGGLPRSGRRTRRWVGLRRPRPGRPLRGPLPRQPRLRPPHPHRHRRRRGCSRPTTTWPGCSWAAGPGGSSWPAWPPPEGWPTGWCAATTCPRSRRSAVMAGAGCALILLADEALGVMSPSKLHANLAAGLPIVYVGPEGSNVDAAIARFGCGVSLRTGDGRAWPTRCGGSATTRRGGPSCRPRARRAFEEAYCDEATLPQWDAVLDRL